MIEFLSVLTVGAQVMLVLGLLEVFLARVRGRSSRAVSLLRGDALRLAALVAVVATAGSLYFSEVRNFTPCELCWFQRIAIYPLALILPVAAWRRDASVWRYVLPLASLGLLVSLYHVQLERFPDQETVSCSATVPCTAIWFQEFGYVTLPVMAATALACVFALLVIAARGARYSAAEHSARA